MVKVFLLNSLLESIKINSNLSAGLLCVKGSYTFGNITSGESMETTVTISSQMAFTGKWSVFNDPNLDESVIPEDEEQREALRVGLLVSDWLPLKVGSVSGGKLNVGKMVTYFYQHHTNHSIPLFICLPARFSTFPQFLLCDYYSKDRIDRMDTWGTFDYTWENDKERFLPDLIILPLVSLTGIFGTNCIFITSKVNV